MNPLLKLLAAVHAHAADVEILLVAERGYRYEADMRHAAVLAAVDQRDAKVAELEKRLEDANTYLAALEHALAGLSWQIATEGEGT
jgi:hypothetical protein